MSATKKFCPPAASFMNYVMTL